MVYEWGSQCGMTVYRYISLSFFFAQSILCLSVCISVHVDESVVMVQIVINSILRYLQVWLQKSI